VKGSVFKSQWGDVCYRKLQKTVENFRLLTMMYWLMPGGYLLRAGFCEGDGGDRGVEDGERTTTRTGML